MTSHKKVAIFALLTALIFKFWIFTSKSNLGSDISYRFLPIVNGIYLPFTWNNVQTGDGMGVYAVNTLWSYPSELFYESLTRFGLPYWFQIKYLMLLPAILISTLGFIKLSKFFKGDWLVSSVLYVLNTYFILLLDGSQMNIVLAYSVFPLTFYFFLSVCEKLSVYLLLKFVFSVWLIGTFDLRIVWILAFVVLIKFIFDFLTVKGGGQRFCLFKNYIVIGLTTTVFLVLLNLYWILPAKFSEGVHLPAGYDSAQQVTNLSFSTITHALYLFQPHWYINSFGKVTNPVWYFAIVPIFAFVPVLLSRKKQYLFLISIAFVGIFLTKGSQPPLGEVYLQLFQKVPGFNLFRDPSKFFFLIAFSYSILVGITSKLISKKSYLPSLVFIIYLVFLMNPVLRGQMTGSFSPVQNEDKYWSFAQLLSSQTDFFRTFSIPVKLPLGYVSFTHPSTEAFSIAEKRPFEIGTVGTYEKFNFLREAPFMGELINVAGIKYLIYPFPDARRKALKQDNLDYYNTFLQQLTNLPWIEKKISDSPVAVLQTKKHQDHFFITPRTFYVVGSDRIYSDLVNVTGFDLSKLALVFAEERPGVVGKPDNLPITNILLYHKSETDLAASFIDKALYIFPAQNLKRDPTDVSPWWKREANDFLSMRNFLQTKYQIDNQDFDYQGGYAVAEGDQQLVVQDLKFKSGNLLLVRVMRSSKSGSIQFWQDNSKIGEVDTLDQNPEQVEIKLTGYNDVPDRIFTYDSAAFDWHLVGKLNSQHPLNVKTSGEINIVNALASVSEQDWNRVNRLTGPYNILDWDKLSDKDKQRLVEVSSDAKVTYTRLSPTEYKVNISGLKSPITLAFSESFDSFWEANGVGSYPLYSFINGFRIDQDGTYDIYFSPQKYVFVPLAISAASLVIIVLILIYPTLRKKL
ncbi:MAG: hypothetical protein UT39_C0003G0007 [Candidatus Woesebacteria bacterium GW2011_GWA1_39_21]|uniref:Uncharacterized protein n=1 Tax=Candidatus Woesebacteria bacterium GW2011_GWA1_39_21 TaxID=1618550 RepID=A0A0G0N8G9_9BACT|nr:MAG: hypothetical protein UT39_C0003G0007 [Candidatus Woesebacteria bacterium GW2011_GWA1_39_21]